MYGNSKYHNILTKDFLIKEYTENRKSVYQINKITGCSPMTIWNYLNKYNIKRRSKTEGYNGEGNPNFGKKHPELNKGIKFSDSHRKNLSLAKKGKYEGRNNPHFGKPIRPRWGKYRGINMRSNWEINYAKYLDNHNIIWTYESKTFDLGDTTYTPDFYLPETNEYVEIKGYFPKEIREKIELFERLYPKTKFKILQGKELDKLGIKIAEKFIK